MPLDEYYDQVLNEMSEIHTAKNTDYGDSVSKTYAEFGLVSYLVRMSDKLNRAISVNRHGVTHVTDEKLYDTLLDLANYAAMAAAEVKKRDINHA